jgi:hypothetical protein
LNVGESCHWTWLIFLLSVRIKTRLFHKLHCFQGFSCSGVEGEDVVELLQAALKRRGDVKVQVAAILNDTTG